MTNDFSSIEELNRRFAIPGITQVLPGNGGLPKVQISTAHAIAAIYLHGAQVTSWCPVGKQEVLFLSTQSHWQDGRAIRGGIPICFPWFRAKADNPKAPAHGLVRTREWQLDAIASNADQSCTVTCSTRSDEATRSLWPFDFRIVQSITVGPSLRMELSVSNIGTTPFHFEEALHTYFAVNDVEHVRVRGLDGIHYLDNTDANREKTQNGELIFAGATDNAYMKTIGTVELVDAGLARAIRTEKENSSTTVAWNPWQQGAAALSDLGDDEWRKMACVEASNILASAIELAPGAEHTMRATLTVAPN